MMGALDELGSRGLIDCLAPSAMALLDNDARSPALSAVVAGAPNLERNAGEIPVVISGAV
jgi:hypothetical protein